MNKLDKQYTDLLQDILDNGVKKSDRTGTGTISVFGRQIRHKMSDGFPLLTTKKMAWKTMVTELLWFLRGDTNIKYLVDNNCHIWDGDAYKRYHTVMNSDDYIENWVEPGKEREEARKNKGNNGYTKEEFINEIKTDNEFAKKWGELGPIYGKQWRKWGSFKDKKELVDGGRGNIFYANVSWEGIDQIANLINELKTNPDSRRLMVNAWNVGELGKIVLLPCHYGFQVYTRELTWGEQVQWVMKNTDVELENVYIVEEIAKQSTPKRAISLMWNQRSVDTFLGLPFNIASYGLLLEIIAKAVNMVPDELIGNLGDTHLYSNHIEQAKEQIGRELSLEERYNIWFNNNYETGMERFFDSNNLPNFNDPYYEPTPKRTREPYPLPRLDIHPGMLDYDLDKLEIDMFKILNYQSHSTIKAPLSN